MPRVSCAPGGLAPDGRPAGPAHAGAISMTTSLLIDTAYFPPQVGGISRMMATICGIVGADDISVLTGVTGVADVPILSGVRIYRRPLVTSRRGASYPFRLALTLAEVIARERPRILQFATIEDVLIAWWTYLILRKPYVVYAHGNEILGVTRSTWETAKKALRAASRVIANSRYTADLVASVGVARARIEIVNPACDVTRFAPAEVDGPTRQRLLGPHWNRRVLLSVGNLVERKGNDVTIKALVRILAKVPDVSYVIVGDGPYRPHLQELARKAGVEDHVLFAGRVSDDDLPLYYRLCEVFVMASRARLEQDDVEGFGIVFLEAGACGKPSVAGRSGGIEDAVIEKETGLLVEPSDPEQLSAAVEILMLQPHVARRLGERARARVLEHNSWAVIGARIRNIIHAVASEQP